MNSDNISIAVLLPVYNENPATLQHIVDELHSFGYHIILVDDGSETQVSIDQENVIILRHRINLGQGAALETGMEYARSKKIDVLIHMDGDGQHQVSEIQFLLNPIIQGVADIVFGSRFLSKSSEEIIPMRRRNLLRISRLANRVFTNTNMSDAHNGFRALNQKAFHEVKLQSSGREHASEIVWRAVKQNLRIKEVPVHILYPEANERIPLPEVIKLGGSLLWKRFNSYNQNSPLINQERMTTLLNSNKMEQPIS